ncbi:hypothetical protein ALP68_101136 [Pseudomonas ficuserectae]|uniref:Uncharacterized protein n=20 Tax=Pseudomonas syringae group TaxID=136849 RepID=A0A0Q0AVD8_PSEAJ|nr:hypothetical protein ALO90_101247 [Pseudomonas amygdali pv. aesculi]KPW39606.1 hypothetical protein ALO51_101102 [Pseudomonas amygdali]KPW56282.1 hypothetical protein ALO80_100967 [Pseudomonas caricapapayae]KPW63947.1 hypothetical protein ALO78_101035 [Pseudomonas amygdali pv. ciccaronei]KPW67202.1 hypothetical protein ALO82_101156 [Pseudomonas syringae pv. broussonetiae]KPW82749.1 hypothetical protein ALO50_101354 [Pseudomonas syringae pv. cerasicola]KPW98887.1 hypothetical protein ALO79_
MTLFQTLEQRLCHHHVTDPARPNDQNFHVLSKNDQKRSGRPIRLRDIPTQPVASLS